MPDDGIDYLIYLRQEKAIIWVDVIQVGVINANYPPSISLRDYHHVCQPIPIFDISNESNCQ